MRVVGLAFLLALVAACGKDSGESAVRAARWDIDKDENLAVPVCAECGEVLDRDRSDCVKCGTLFKIEPKTIDCPECAGRKTCTHCGEGQTCAVCEGSGKCTVCAATGALDGSSCPDCDGAKSCGACAGPGATCERCEGTRTCANCDGEGTITLR